MNQHAYIQIPNASKNVSLTLKHLARHDDVVAGNKYYKLKYNISAAKQQNVSTVLTFGGAYSNHIAATASYAKQQGLQAIGVIRGDELASVNFENLNLTLQYAAQQGMRLHFVTRQQYRQKHQSDFAQMLREKFGDVYIIPEGGTNTLAVKGCEDILSESDKQSFDVVCTPVGTGGTIAGLINSVQECDNAIQILGFAAVNDASLLDTVNSFTKPDMSDMQNGWQINNDYGLGGYAKTPDELIMFINEFKTEHGVQLDPIYTGKMMFGIFDLIRKDVFKSGVRILALHTGGLQGIAGVNQRLLRQGKDLIVF